MKSYCEFWRTLGQSLSPSDSKMQEPIDAVVTWVDGYDPAHAEKLAHYFSRMGLVRPEAAAPTRYNQCGEIEFCIRSIFRFAPWIRTLYIVTDAQTPPLLGSWIGTSYQGKVKLIDHRDIFSGYEQFLPTFNSMTIESMLWRIEGLSERFIYLNDDCFMIREVQETDFFRENKLVLRGKWRKQSQGRWVSSLKNKITVLLKSADVVGKIDLFRTVQEKTAQWAGWNKSFFQLDHAPFPLKKSDFEHFFHNHPDIFIQNLNYAIRDPKQLWVLSLIQHLAIRDKKVVFDDSLSSISVHGAQHSISKIKKRLSRALKNNHVAFICMQSMDESPPETQAFMLDWIKKCLL